jgi:positive regulator of sigma E activity
MNSGFLIILVPAFLVAIGYILIFRYLGVAPGYGRLALGMIVFFGGMWWLGRRYKKRTDPAKQLKLENRN